MDERLRAMIHEGAAEQEMILHARSQCQSMLADGRDRVLAGETSAEEVLRVTSLE